MTASSSPKSDPKTLAQGKLILALDVDTVERARELVAMLRDHVGMFKIGSQLFTATGPGLVREIVTSGSRVFLDLKFHDIPNTVAAAGVAATRLGVSIFNVHASGGSEMMRRTADAVANTAIAESLARPSVIAVTVLTSADASVLSSVGLNCEPDQQVTRLALLAAASGMDGVVASPHEVSRIRAAVSAQTFLVVTPGVRPSDSASDDQRRVMTPAQAMTAGADYLVVGRPILRAANPVETARAIVADMAEVLC